MQNTQKITYGYGNRLVTTAMDNNGITARSEERCVDTDNAGKNPLIVTSPRTQISGTVGAALKSTVGVTHTDMNALPLRREVREADGVTQLSCHHAGI